MAQIVGIFRTGEDAVVRYTQNGEPVAGLSLAFNYGRKGDDGKRPSQWISASLWGKRAEAMAQYLKKGGMVYCVIKDPHIETYQKKDGGEGFKLVGSIAEIEFAGGKPEGGTRAPADGAYSSAQQPSQQPQKRDQFEDLGDDIPFN